MGIAREGWLCAGWLRVRPRAKAAARMSLADVVVSEAEAPPVAEPSRRRMRVKMLPNWRFVKIPRKIMDDGYENENLRDAERPHGCRIGGREGVMELVAEELIREQEK